MFYQIIKIHANPTHHWTLLYMCVMLTCVDCLVIYFTFWCSLLYWTVRIVICICMIIIERGEIITYPIIESTTVLYFVCAWDNDGYKQTEVVRQHVHKAKVKLASLWPFTWFNFIYSKLVWWWWWWGKGQIVLGCIYNVQMFSWASFWVACTMFKCSLGASFWVACTMFKCSLGAPSCRRIIFVKNTDVYWIFYYPKHWQQSGYLPNTLCTRTYRNMFRICTALYNKAVLCKNV